MTTTARPEGDPMAHTPRRIDVNVGRPDDLPPPPPAWETVYPATYSSLRAALARKTERPYDVSVPDVELTLTALESFFHVFDETYARLYALEELVAQVVAAAAPGHRIVVNSDRTAFVLELREPAPTAERCTHCRETLLPGEDVSRGGTLGPEAGDHTTFVIHRRCIDEYHAALDLQPT